MKAEADRRPSARHVLGKSGRWLFLLLLFGQNWLCVNAAAEENAERNGNDGKVAAVGSSGEREQMEEIPQRWKHQKEKTQLR